MIEESGGPHSLLPSNDTWEILVVDDEEDIHSVTRLALKNKTWRRRKFTLTHARSAAEAREILTKRGKDFRVALVDVVMESDDAGLKLSAWIRAFCPNSLRIILRTGQAGVAPEHYVLNQFDIDYYVHKTELDVDRLYRVICSALRSSQDIATLLSFATQLRNFTAALQRVSSVEDLRLFMLQGLEFLGSKHDAQIHFYHDLEREFERDDVSDLYRLHVQALLRLHEAEVGELKPLLHEAHGLGEQTMIVMFKVFIETRATSDQPVVVLAGVVCEFAAQNMSNTAVESCARDLLMFIENWRTAYVALQLQKSIAQERMLREQMYFDRLQMIANMVAGVAHEINTPLGVASTANSMIAGLAQDLVDRLKNNQPAGDIVSDLEESVRLLSKNLQRAHQLIKSFKQLSSSSLSDHRTQTSVLVILRDCIETLSPETKKRGLRIELKTPTDDPLAWDGFPGYLEHVVVNLIQNTMKHGYPTGPGKLEIRVEQVVGKAGLPQYKLEFEDWGAGIPAKVLPRVFDPFVTTKRSEGGTGLGLAITRNIVNDLLRGHVSVRSVEGRGTVFTLVIPCEVPQSTARLSQQPPPLSI